MLNERELATVLVALRRWQRESATHNSADSLHQHSSTNKTGLLNIDEIDALCDRLGQMPSADEYSYLCRIVAASAEHWQDCSDLDQLKSVLQQLGESCRWLIQQATSVVDLEEVCECELPGYFWSGVPGIIARIENGRLAPEARVERCDICERYPSDQAALDKLRDLGMA